jgi:hypothetical protein
MDLFRRNRGQAFTFHRSFLHRSYIDRSFICHTLHLSSIHCVSWDRPTDTQRTDWNQSYELYELDWTPTVQPKQTIMTTPSPTPSDAALQDAVTAIRSHRHHFDVVIICTSDDYQSAYWMDRLSSTSTTSPSTSTSTTPTPTSTIPSPTSTTPSPTSTTPSPTPTSTPPPPPLVLAVAEDWSNTGGAGNGLGTLYAWRRACALAHAQYGRALDQELAAGHVSCAMYHTAGKGTRLAPLPAAEANNKPGVQLPFPVRVVFDDNTNNDTTNNDTNTTNVIRPILTVLEAVVRQTALYARPGRLSVFWGDQVFIPSAPFAVPATHHVEILCTLLVESSTGDWPTAEEWHTQGLEKYGVIAVLQQQQQTTTSSRDGTTTTVTKTTTEAAQVEKVSHATAVEMLGTLPGTVQAVGPSLGSFSLSADILQALVEEFHVELQEKQDKFDTDPHFWMPLTLALPSYVQLMQQKGTDAATATTHFNRMARMRERFLVQQAGKQQTDTPQQQPLGLFGALNVGKDSCWWDYGLLRLYRQNAALLLDPDDKRAALLRQFLGCDEERILGSTVAPGATVDDTSYVVASTLGDACVVTHSLVANVTCPALMCSGGAIVINCVAKKIVAAPGSILYNLLDESDEGIVVAENEVRVGLCTVLADGDLSFDRVLCSRMDIDGGQVWKERLAMNDASFEEVYQQNKNADIGRIARERQAAFARLAEKMGL